MFYNSSSKAKGVYEKEKTSATKMDTLEKIYRICASIGKNCEDKYFFSVCLI